jgi:DNA-binding transcriptional LysR family regulator
MALGGVDLNLLVVLEALLEEGNVTRAGVRVGMPQPAMSNALARLRRHYGDELLMRSGNGYTLTPLARSLLPSARESMRLIGDALSPGHAARPPAANRDFLIGLSDYSTAVLAEPLLRRVRELAPEVRVRVRSAATDVVVSDLALAQPDLLIGPPGALGSVGPIGARAGGAEPEVILRDRLVYVVDPANPRLRDGRLTTADLAALPHAVARLTDAGPAAATAALERAGITATVVLTTAGWLPLPFLIAGTDLVAAIPERLARKLASTAGVTVIRPPFGSIEVTETAWWHPMRATDPALTWLRTILREITGAAGS